MKELAEHGLMLTSHRLEPESLRANVMKMTECASLLPNLEIAKEHAAEAFFSATESTLLQLDLIAEYQMMGRAAMRPMVFFCRYFPSAYVGALEKLVHPDWYVACFSSNPTNASMWGTYGDGHRGACLTFKTTPYNASPSTLSLERVTGLGGTPKGGCH